MDEEIKEKINKVIYTLYPSLKERNLTLSKITKTKFKTRIICTFIGDVSYTEFTVDTRNFRPLKRFNETIPYTKEIKQVLNSIYQHSYYMQTTKEKRRIIRENKPSKTTICKICGKSFKQKASSRKSICRACKNKAKIKPTYTLICKACGETFTTLDPRKVYCSEKCRYSFNSRQSYRRRHDLPLLPSSPYDLYLAPTKNK